MDDTAKDIAGLGVATFEKSLDHIGKTSIACLVGLNYLTGQLVQCNEMVVFIQYLIGNVHVVIRIEWGLFRRAPGQWNKRE